MHTILIIHRLYSNNIHCNFLNIGREATKILPFFDKQEMFNSYSHVFKQRRVPKHMVAKFTTFKKALEAFRVETMFRHGKVCHLA